jgi:hypothetical protein
LINAVRPEWSSQAVKSVLDPGRCGLWWAKKRLDLHEAIGSRVGAKTSERTRIKTVLQDEGADPLLGQPGEVVEETAKTTTAPLGALLDKLNPPPKRTKTTRQHTPQLLSMNELCLLDNDPLVQRLISTSPSLRANISLICEDGDPRAKLREFLRKYHDVRVLADAVLIATGKATISKDGVELV